jgi:hypothetical protein
MDKRNSHGQVNGNQCLCEVDNQHIIVNPKTFYPLRCGKKFVKDDLDV